MGSAAAGGLGNLSEGAAGRCQPPVELSNEAAPVGINVESALAGR